MRKTLISSFALTLLISTFAHAQVYKCIGVDGRITYTNDRNVSRECTVVENQNVSSIPTSSGSNTTATEKPATPFPTVTPNAQRTRDAERRKLLELELSTEKSALTDAEKALAEQEAIRAGNEHNYQKVLDRLQPYKEKVDVHKRNIDALQKEIKRLPANY